MVGTREITMQNLSISRWSAVWTSGIVLVTMVALGPPAEAQSWSGSVSGALVTQSTHGSPESFRTQWGLDEGFVLENLDLQYVGVKSDDESERRFTLKAWGFGSAEPAQGGRFEALSEDWRFRLDYRRTESFFALAESGLGQRQDDWRLDRWHGDLTWEGWDAARLTLRLGLVRRQGHLTQPFRELNESYLLGVELDEERTEAAFRLETRTLPVRLVFEQSLARLVRQNRLFPGDERNQSGDDPDLLVGAESDRREEREIPTSRLTATYGSDRLEVAGSLLWSPGDLDMTGESTTTFGLAEDTSGRVQFADNLLGSASLDAFAGRLALGLRLAPQWALRLTGEHRDRAVDGALLGQRILRLSNAFGDGVEIPSPVDEKSFFDTTDSSLRVELEHRRDNWSVWAGVTDARREVAWQRTDDDDSFAADRDATGGVLGLSWDRGRRLRGSLEYEHNSFEQFVFRTDPATTERLTAKLRGALSGGFAWRLRGRFEDASRSEEDGDPEAQSSLDRSSSSLGLGLTWTSEDGKKGCGVDVDQIDLTTDTRLLFPDGSLGLSRYDLALRTLGAHGRWERGKLRLSGNAHYLEDDGETWPLTAWTARLRATVLMAGGAEVAVFGNYVSYDETGIGGQVALGDDFEVTRFGVAFGWRFE
jgi:hypothetical protein